MGKRCYVPRVSVSPSGPDAISEIYQECLDMSSEISFPLGFAIIAVVIFVVQQGTVIQCNFLSCFEINFRSVWGAVHLAVFRLMFE